MNRSTQLLLALCAADLLLGGASSIPGAAEHLAIGGYLLGSLLPALFALGTLVVARHPSPAPAEALINATTESAVLLTERQPRALSWTERALIGALCVHGVASALACASNPHLQHLTGFLAIVPLVALICAVPGLIDAAGSATRRLRLLLDRKRNPPQAMGLQSRW